jgi:hypothetical protein
MKFTVIRSRQKISRSCNSVNGFNIYEEAVQLLHVDFILISFSVSGFSFAIKNFSSVTEMVGEFGL